MEARSFPEVRGVDYCSIYVIKNTVPVLEERTSQNIEREQDVRRYTCSKMGDSWPGKRRRNHALKRGEKWRERGLEERLREKERDEMGGGGDVVTDHTYETCESVTHGH